MIVTEYRITYKGYTDKIYIKPIFDIHAGNTYCDIAQLKRDLANCPKNTYFFTGGDMMDSIVVNELRYTKDADATTGKAILDEQIDLITEILMPYKARLIGVGAGNHEEKVLNKCSTDLVARLARRLGCANLGYSGIIILRLNKKSGGGGRTVRIHWHHGWGGSGRTAGGTITKYSKDMTNYECDVFFYGHDHHCHTYEHPRFTTVGKRLMSKDLQLGICGTYLKTFSDTTDAPYSEIAGYPPLKIGGLILEIKPTDTWVEMKLIK